MYMACHTRYMASHVLATDHGTRGQGGRGAEARSAAGRGHGAGPRNQAPFGRKIFLTEGSVAPALAQGTGSPAADPAVRARLRVRFPIRWLLIGHEHLIRLVIRSYIS